jgi:iron complex outermembrane receptor protein
MFLRRTLPVFAALAMATPCFSNPTTTNLYVAPPVVVTATRTSRTPETIPAQVTVITAEQMSERGSLNVVDALRDLGGLQIRSLNGNPAQAELSLRGFGENAHGRTLILRDGQRLNSPDMAGVNWLQLPVSSVARIEVLEGPQSVLYGDHALAGVVNIITHDEARPERTEARVQAGSYDTYGASLATHRQSGATQGTAGGDWQTSKGYRHNGGFDSLNLRAGVDSVVNEALRTSIFGTYDRMVNGLPSYLTRDAMQADPRQTTAPDDEAATDTYNANLALNWRPTADQTVNAAFIYNRREAETDFVSWMSFADTAVDSLTFTLNHQLDASLFDLPTRLLSGVDLYFDRLDADRYADADGTMHLLSAVVDKTSLGAYLNNETDLTDKLMLTLGGRIEQASYAADVEDAFGASLVDDSETHTVSALTASLLYRPADATKLYASFSSLYRLPFLDEQVSYYGYGSDTFYDDLEPEHGLSGEVGGAWRFAREWSAELNVFCMEVKDEIAYNPVTSRNDNLDKTRHQGTSAAIGWQRAELGALKLRYTFTDATFQEGVNDGCEVPLVPNHHLALVGQANLPLDLALLATLNVSGSQYVGGDNANAAETLESFTTLDLALRYAPARLPDFSLLIGVDNVFDESYATVAYAGFMETGYYPAPGRTWKTALAYAF